MIKFLGMNYKKDEKLVAYIDALLLAICVGSPIGLFIGLILKMYVL